jgi:hypothetical protein
MVASWELPAAGDTPEPTEAAYWALALLLIRAIWKYGAKSLLRY